MRHTTRDGQVMLIAEMTDKHLKNTISLYIDSLGHAKNVINGKTDTFQNKLVGNRDSKVDAERFVDGYNNLFPSYIFEAVLRGVDIEKYMKKVRKLHDRDSQLAAMIELPAP